MGQTLTNGLYLPGEGERYCYDGLASNWTILDAVVGGYNAHIENTTIHISSEERIKWNTGVTQAYVLRYASSSVSANSTVAYSSLDNVDNVKIGDKVLDQDGKMYSVTAVDSANSQITVGALLIDLSKDSDLSNYYTKAEVDALDSNAVHKTGNETITGTKRFSDNPVIGSSNTNITLSNREVTANATASTTGNHSSNYMQLKAMVTYADNSSIRAVVALAINEDAYADGKRSALYPVSNNVTNLGNAGKRWANVYATNYYYGSSEVEFSTKFVTTDTAQTITYPKTFTTPPSFTGYPSIRLYSQTDDIAVLPSSVEQRDIRFTDKNNAVIAYFIFQHRNDASEPFRTCWRQRRLDGTDNYYSVNFNNLGEFYPENNNAIKLGTSTKRWKDCQTYLVNGLTPSSLSMPNIANKIDISGYITDLTGGSNTYTPPANGWICIQTDNSSVNNYIRCDYDVIMVKSNGNGQASGLSCLIPVITNIQVGIRVVCTTLSSAYFIPCQGNI